VSFAETTNFIYVGSDPQWAIAALAELFVVSQFPGVRIERIAVHGIVDAIIVVM
jgi:hypothetical protein